MANPMGLDSFIGSMEAQAQVQVIVDPVTTPQSSTLPEPSDAVEELATAVEAPEVLASLEVLGAVTLKQLTKFCLLARQQGRATDFRACWKLDLISESDGSDYRNSYHGTKGRK